MCIVRGHPGPRRSRPRIRRTYVPRRSSLGRLPADGSHSAPGPVDVLRLREFVRGLAPATRAAVAETVQPLPGQ